LTFISIFNNYIYFLIILYTHTEYHVYTERTVLKDLKF